jgi:transposase
MDTTHPENPHRDKRLMRDLFIRQNLTARDIADRMDLHPKTVRRWLKKHNVKRPWRQRDVMYQMYIRDGLTQYEIADRFNCRSTTISKWLRRHGIETPDGSELVEAAVDTHRTNYATFYTEKRGYEIWSEGNKGPEIYVHRLLAVSEYGFEALKDKQVHHRNGVPWDNRPENIEPIGNSDHQKLHGRGKLWAE